MLLASVRRKLRRYGPARRAFNSIVAGLLALVALDLQPAAAEPMTITAFGDSLIAGFGLPADQAFPAQLEAALKAAGYPVRVINAGVSGDTSAAGAARLDWSLADKPDLVLVSLGANDMLRGIDPAETERNLDRILERLTAQHVRVLLCGMYAGRNLGAEYVQRFEAIFPRLAKKYGVAFYPFFLDGVALDSKLNQPDGIHPNQEGVQVIVQRMLPVIEPLLPRHG